MVCDLGCGLGRLDIELAPYVAGICAIDTSGSAVEMLRRDIGSLGIKNVNVMQGTTDDIQGSFDVILLSLFGSVDTTDLLRHCRRRLIRIVSTGRKSGLYPAQHRRKVKNTVPDVREELQALGIGFDLEVCSFQFGQPLLSRQDAQAFVLSNAPDATPSEIGAFLEENIEHTGRPDFPLYLPYNKELGIFIIDMDMPE